MGSPRANPATSSAALDLATFSFTPLARCPSSPRSRLTAPSSAVGFTLVELLIAVVIVAVGLLAVALLQTQALRHNHSALQQSEIQMLAQALLDLARSDAVAARNGAYNLGRLCTPPTATAPEAQMLAALHARLTAALGPAAAPCLELSCDAAGRCRATLEWREPRARLSERRTLELRTQL
ncbi:MAG: type IV pilus modification protein PilV [Hydrogenophilus sp.]|nr:type IV pilus modification protein PilV [Hydrogenophilus sp.]